VTAPARSEAALLSKLVAGQAQSDQRFEELFRRLDRAEETAGEARDIAKELVTILREQDIGSRIVELRNEMRGEQAALRHDFVLANGNLRQQTLDEVDARKRCTSELCDRLDSLEADRNKVIGVSGFFTWLSKVAPWLLAGIAAFVAGLGLKGGTP